MDINVLIPVFMVISVSGSSLSIAAYSAFMEKDKDKRLLLIIATFFSLAFVVSLLLSFITLENMTFNQYILTLMFYALIFLAVLSVIGFIFHRLKIDQQMRNEELESSINIIESSKDGLNNPKTFEPYEKLK
jgi:heme/copper-type cytochrome/quinol oxidase subunit 3